jgi:hypothetical protein
VVPDLLKLFFTSLYSGPGEVSDSVQRKIESSCQDAVFNVDNGTRKTRKQILLAMAVKSMTGSKQLVTILNRLGNVISYSKVEEIETSLAASILERKESCPPGVSGESGVVGLAFDNYEELCYTLSGANTLHDTMGILYCSSKNKAVMRQDVIIVVRVSPRAVRLQHAAL